MPYLEDAVDAIGDDFLFLLLVFVDADEVLDGVLLEILGPKHEIGEERALPTASVAHANDHILVMRNLHILERLLQNVYELVEIALHFVDGVAGWQERRQLLHHLLISVVVYISVRTSFLLCWQSSK